MMGVLTGSVKISVPSANGRDIVLNIIHEDEIFGEIALLDGHPRTADATVRRCAQRRSRVAEGHRVTHEFMVTR